MWTIAATSGQMENYCRVSFQFSHQDLNLTDARVERDNKDCTKIYEWLQQHLPFPGNPHLVLTSTGIVADNSVNCHKVWDVVMQGIRTVVSDDFGKVKFKPSDRVQPLAVMNFAIRIENNINTINSTTLFQRISVAKHSQRTRTVIDVRSRPLLLASV